MVLPSVLLRPSVKEERTAGLISGACQMLVSPSLVPTGPPTWTFLCYMLDGVLGATPRPDSDFSLAVPSAGGMLLCLSRHREGLQPGVLQ